MRPPPIPGRTLNLKARLKIYTKGGDEGGTTLLGGARVSKDDARVAAYGSVDELNAVLGTVLALDRGQRTLGDAAPALRSIQEDLFTIGARLAASNPNRLLRQGTMPPLEPERIRALESRIDALDAELPSLDAFVLPGGSRLAAQLHLARTVARRAERTIATLLGEQPGLAEVIVPYINRLSDLLFMLARAANHRMGREDAVWLPQRRRDGDA